jgi:hypothetical protein
MNAIKILLSNLFLGEVNFAFRVSVDFLILIIDIVDVVIFLNVFEIVFVSFGVIVAFEEIKEIMKAVSVEVAEFLVGVPIVVVVVVKGVDVVVEVVEVVVFKFVVVVEVVVVVALVVIE